MGNRFKKAWKKIKKVFTPKKPEIPEQQTGDLVNKDAADASIPIIYGTRKTGGTRVFVSTGTVGAANNKYLYICLAISEGEIDSITEIQLNDVPIAEADSTAIDATGEDIATIDGNYNNLTVYQIFKGTNNQGASTLLRSAGSEWGLTHRLRGVAYIAFRFYWNADKFSSIPVITAIVKGRKVFNPSNNTTAWSDNPALCLRDYLTNPIYGKGLAAASIDDTSFNAAAAACNIPVTSYTGGDSIPLLTCNAILKSSNTLFDNVKILLNGMRGLMPYTNGKYSVFIDRELPSGYQFFDLTPDNMITDLQVVSTSKKDRYNRVKVKFTNPETNWQPDFAIWPPSGSSVETTMLSEDGGEVMSNDSDMPSVTNFYRARDLARIICLTSRTSTFNLEVTGLSECLEIAVGDVVRIEQPSMGWVDNGTEDARQFFRVIGTQIMSNGEVDLSLQQYSSSTYIWAIDSEISNVPSTVLPNPYAISPPTNLSTTAEAVLRSDGSLQSTINVTWDAPANAFVDSYDVQYKKQGVSVYTSSSSTINEFIITDVVKDVVYDIRVRAVSSIGSRSTFLNGVSTGQGDTTAPSLPTSVVVNEGLKNLTISWVVPPEFDYSHCEVHRFVPAVPPATTGSFIYIGNAIQSFTDQSLDYGVTKAYRLKSVDYSGNKSALSASTEVQGTTASVSSNAFVGGVTGLFTDNDLKPIPSGNTLPAASSANLGDYFFLTTDNLLYRCVTQVGGGFQFRTVVNAADLGKTITSDNIVANTITAGLLATSGVITNTAQIEDGVIRNANIFTAAVNSLKIADEAAIIPRSASGTGDGTNTVGGTWKLLSSTPNLSFSSDNKPSKIAILTDVNLLGRTGQGDDFWSGYTRIIKRKLVGSSYVDSTNLAQVGISIRAGQSYTLSLSHTYTPVLADGVGIRFRVDVFTTTKSWTVNENNITAIGCVR